jgi:hypothetical protein
MRSSAIAEIAMQTVPITPLTVTLPTAEMMSGLSRWTLRRRAIDGTLETVLVGGRRLVVVESLKKLLGVDEGKVKAK